MLQRLTKDIQSLPRSKTPAEHAAMGRTSQALRMLDGFIFNFRSDEYCRGIEAAARGMVFGEAQKASDS